MYNDSNQNPLEGHNPDSIPVVAARKPVLTMDALNWIKSNPKEKEEVKEKEKTFFEQLQAKMMQFEMEKLLAQMQQQRLQQYRDGGKVVKEVDSLTPAERKWYLENGYDIEEDGVMEYGKGGPVNGNNTIPDSFYIESNVLPVVEIKGKRRAGSSTISLTPSDQPTNSEFKKKDNVKENLKWLAMLTADTATDQIPNSEHVKAGLDTYKGNPITGLMNYAKIPGPIILDMLINMIQSNPTGIDTEHLDGYFKGQFKDKSLSNKVSNQYAKGGLVKGGTEKVQEYQQWLNKTYGTKLTTDGAWGKATQTAYEQFVKTNPTEFIPGVSALEPVIPTTENWAITKSPKVNTTYNPTVTGGNTPVSSNIKPIEKVTTKLAPYYVIGQNDNVYEPFGKTTLPYEGDVKGMDKIKQFNKGVTYEVPRDSIVASHVDGSVERITQLPDGAYAVIINNNGTRYVISNLKNITVKQGAKIKKGDALGLPETNINATDKHTIEYQVWKNGKPVNPTKSYALGGKVIDEYEVDSMSPEQIAELQAQGYDVEVDDIMHYAKGGKVQSYKGGGNTEDPLKDVMIGGVPFYLAPVEAQNRYLQTMLPSPTLPNDNWKYKKQDKTPSKTKDFVAEQDNTRVDIKTSKKIPYKKPDLLPTDKEFAEQNKRYDDNAIPRMFETPGFNIGNLANNLFNASTVVDGAMLGKQLLKYGVEKALTSYGKEAFTPDLNDVGAEVYAAKQPGKNIVEELREELRTKGIVESQKTPDYPWKDIIYKGVEPYGYDTSEKLRDVFSLIVNSKNPSYLSPAKLEQKYKNYTMSATAYGNQPLTKEEYISQILYPDQLLKTNRDLTLDNFNRRFSPKRSMSEKNRYSTWGMYLGKPQTKHPLYDISELTKSKDKVVYTIKEEFINKKRAESTFDYMLDFVDKPREDFDRIMHGNGRSISDNEWTIQDADGDLFGTMGGFNWNIKRLEDGNFKIMANDVWDLQPFKKRYNRQSTTLKGKAIDKLTSSIRDVEIGKALGIGKPLDVQVGFIVDGKTKKIINTFGLAGATVGAASLLNNEDKTKKK